MGSALECCAVYSRMICISPVESDKTGPATAVFRSMAMAALTLLFCLCLSKFNRSPI